MSYALSAWSAPQTRARVLRRRVVLRLPRLALRLAGWPHVTIATRDAGAPYVVEAALQQLGLEDSVDWLLICGQSDDLGRAAFLLFPESAPQPRWLVKFVRVPGYSDPIDRDERALQAVAAAGGAAAAHAPRFVGRFEVSGLAASIETAAAGRRLSAVLGSAASRSAKTKIVDAVAEWIVRVGVETCHDGVAPELERLRTGVVGSWPDAPDDLLNGLSGLPAVLQHNDLGTWNIISDGGSDFTAVDWESANPSGLPLWDLWYFLAHALRLLDGEAAADAVPLPVSSAARRRRRPSCFAGRAPRSTRWESPRRWSGSSRRSAGSTTGSHTKREAQPSTGWPPAARRSRPLRPRTRTHGCPTPHWAAAGEAGWTTCETSTLIP